MKKISSFQFFTFHCLIFLDDSVAVKEEFNFRLESLVPNVMKLHSADRFYTYEGSLSTPGCYESVTWIVMATYLPVTESEVMDPVYCFQF